MGNTYPPCVSPCSSWSNPSTPRFGFLSFRAWKRLPRVLCLNVSSFSRKRLCSQSGCVTRGHGFVTCCRAAGMEIIFCTAELNLVV